MEPRRGDRIHLERPQGHGAKHAIEVRGKPRIKDLAQSIVMESGTPSARLEERSHPTLLEPGAHLIEGMMPV